MKTLSGVSLAPFTTLKVGGPVGRVFIPESMDEFLLLLDSEKLVRVIGFGSNLLVSDAGHSGAIGLTRRLRRLIYQDGLFVAETGVPLRALIAYAARFGRGGIEYLASVPGTVGGAIVNNAGRGRRSNCQIGDVVVSVRVWCKGRVFDVSGSQLDFTYRGSVFHGKPDWVILSAKFSLPLEESVEAAVRKRLRQVSRTQERQLPNAGSVFKEGLILPVPRNLRVRGGAEWFERTFNWIINRENASSHDVETLIRDARRIHTDAGLPAPVLEWQTIGPVDID